MQHVPDLLGPNEASGLMESAYRRLKREIIDLRRSPGSSLTEPQVADEYGLSKTPVREALARLQRDGLVSPIPRAGYVVSPITLGDAADLCDLRSILQTEAAGLCAQRGLDTASEARLVELTDDSSDDSQSDPESFERRVRSNFEYEAIIANGSGNLRLAQAVARLLDDIERIARLAYRINPSGAPSRQSERRAITSAIVARDIDAARAATKARTATSRLDIFRALASSGSLASVAISEPSRLGRDLVDALDGI